MLNNFIYTKTKDFFLKELEAGNVSDEAIVFIEDTKEIWNRGTYFGNVNGLGVLTEENLLAGDTLTKDPESGNIEIITGTTVIESFTPFVPFAKGEGKKLGVALGDGFTGESSILDLKIGTIASDSNFVPLCIGSCVGYHGEDKYFGIALGSGLKCNEYNELELDGYNNTGGNNTGGLNIGSSLMYENGKLDVRFSSNSALSVEQNGISIRIGTEFDVEEYDNTLHVKLGTEVNEKTRHGFGLCVDRNNGLSLSLAPGTNPLSVNEYGELYINIEILKELLNVES